MRIRLGVIASLIAWPAVALAQHVPAGTALPVVLNTTLDSNKLVAGQAISAVVAQDVPLPDRGKIRSGSQVTGQVLNTGSTRDGKTYVRFKFNLVREKGRDLP